MKATVHLANPEETVRVEVDQRDRRAFERDGRRLLELPVTGTVKEAVEQAPERYVAFLVWNCLRRDGLTNGLAFAAWEDRRLIEVTPEEDPAETPDPTNPAP